MSDTAQEEIDANLLVVTAVQGYATNHHLTEQKAYEILSEHNMLSLIRGQYGVLHTQPLEETVAFVEDVMKRISV